MPTQISYHVKPAEFFVPLPFFLGLWAMYGHLPFGVIVQFTSGAFIILYYMISTGKNSGKKAQVWHPSLGVAAGFWCMYISLRILRLDGSSIVLFMAVAISALCIYGVMKKQVISFFPAFLLSLFGIAGICIFFTPTHRIYHFFTFSENLNDTDYRPNHWDNYSRYLYDAGEYEKALDANDKAKQAFSALPATFTDPTKSPTAMWQNV